MGTNVALLFYAYLCYYLNNKDKINTTRASSKFDGADLKEFDVENQEVDMRKNELAFAIAWIVIYVAGLSTADNLSRMFGIEKVVTLPVCILLTVILIVYMKEKGLFRKYGLSPSKIPAGKMLFYLPLCIMASVNLWFGVAMNLSIPETILYILSMVFVGFLEEIIFRGLLFKAMCKENVTTAIIVSSVTFGSGHIVNLFNGSGAQLLASILQVIYATAAGFLFTIIFYRTGSLWACIITHGVLNALSVFANEAAMTPVTECVSALILTVISVLYGMYVYQMRDESRFKCVGH